MGKSKAVPIEERVKKRTVMQGECLIWMGSRTTAGYGMISINDKTSSLSRAVWESANGPIPPGMQVMHKCDNPPCCNIEHLTLGTPKDNQQDCTNKDRRPVGDRHYHSKLSSKDISGIRVFLESGMKHKNIAEMYGVSKSNITVINRGKGWKHIPK
jgi:hypothetical protein